jgi:1-deoxy-D-xylulose-5-phosphate reductoisomerase
MINTKKRLAIIGATGSIGTQTLDIVANHPERYSVSVMTAANRVDELIDLAKKHRPALAIIANPTHYHKLRDALGPLGIDTASGSDAIADAMDRDDFDTVVTATVGYSGLVPTIRAIAAGKDIALANKETLVVAGDLINSLLSRSKSRMFAIDSEHSAIAQCLAGESKESVKRLIITASGGPFRTWNINDLEHATVADALNHPNWSMGSKITIDSATMMNKAFEIIEAHHLFGIEPEKITAVVHPQSIVHSMVEFVDGAIKAQLGVPDMRLPIAYALGENSRLTGVSPALTLEAMSHLTFEAPDTEKFPCLTLAHTALTQRGNTACVINAANEVAVASFLNRQIKFLDIYRTIEHTLAHADFIAEPTFDDFVATNDAARAIAREYIKNSK